MAMQDNACRIEFDRATGGLRGIVNRITGDACLKGGRTDAMPFRIGADLTEEFEIGLNEQFQLVFAEPESITRTLLTPERCELLEANEDGGITLRYRGGGLDIGLRVRWAGSPGVSDWSLRITNLGDATREVLSCFPYLDGVRLGPDAATNLATAMDQGGVTVPAWERAGGVLGESNQMSMQWHAIFDPASHSALAVIFMDPDVHPKRLVLREPSIALHHFPPSRIAPGETLDLPPARIVVYQGDWRPAARHYRAWYETAYAEVEPPAWFRASNGLVGRHFKKGGAGIASDYVGQYALETFRELPRARILSPLDNWEYAFYSHRCMIPGVHTDGDNIVREDMGGAEAMRDGIAGSRRLGLHTTLYVEGYIVSRESDLAKTGKAERWAVMQKDGTRTGPYVNQGFAHMCPGCVEWQDHLAESVARLLRETGADGVRLDSLGFYYLPCYNPEHHHESPFGYNEWIKQLLAKVRAAAIQVNPDVLLLTEGSADWFGQWFHGALTSRCPRDLSMMRLAVGPFRPYVYASGALWGSLAGFAGGGCGGTKAEGLDWNWMLAEATAHEALIWGDVADVDPTSSDPEIVSRRFEGDGYWAVVAARPACQDPLVWPRGTTISDTHAAYTLTFEDLGSLVEDAVYCDVETLTWAPLAMERDGADARVRLETNWALIILRRVGGPQIIGFDPLPARRPGDTVSFQIGLISPQSDSAAPPRSVHITAHGLDVPTPDVAVPGQTILQIPVDALPGYYAIFVESEGALGVKRFLVIEEPNATP
ncbi:MAG TPA: DUF6259 domain-containing protein [Candidatus Hydrogenedentes bacterium]|nr:DUF6259 domain-containing protein [Candidatus Hydrogenedentota bacterium]HPG65662.1 DUF6259 domain-containing protein [Candidatus Hydrogenedentota bacterium]